MKNVTKKALLVFGMVTISSTLSLAEEIKSMEDAVNMAGKQRMFTQRMLKDYAMVGMQNTFGNPSEDLKNIMNEFHTNLEMLKKYTKSDETKKNLEKVTTLWSSINKILEAVPNKDVVGKLQEDLDTLLQAADTATKSFAKESGKASGEIVNKAGRQRMLSQKMASLYMLKVWGVEDPQFKVKLDEAMGLFKTSLSELEKSSLNTEEITTLLAKVKRSFMFFEMMGRSSSKFVPTLIYKKSNDMLANMNSVTQAYVALETK